MSDEKTSPHGAVLYEYDGRRLVKLPGKKRPHYAVERKGRDLAGGVTWRTLWTDAESTDDLAIWAISAIEDLLEQARRDRT